MTNKYLEKPNDAIIKLIHDGFEIMKKELETNAKLKKSLKKILNRIFEDLPPVSNDKIIQRFIDFYTQNVNEIELNHFFYSVVIDDNNMRGMVMDKNSTMENSYSMKNGYSKLDMAYIYIVSTIQMEFYCLKSYNKEPKLKALQDIVTKYRYETNDRILEKYPEYII